MIKAHAERGKNYVSQKKQNWQEQRNLSRDLGGFQALLLATGLFMPWMYINIYPKVLKYGEM